MLPKDAVWFITGSSKGLGRALAEQVLSAGYRAVLGARNPAEVTDIVESHRTTAFAVQLDVTHEAQIEAAIRSAQERFGSIDVLVNNAGYGYFAAIEEGDDAEVRALFDTNVFAPWHLIRAVLPGMRQRKSGHIVNISSIGGLVAFPAVGFYHMSKFALEALSETLAKEVAPFGIGVTVVEPGAFRTDFRGPSGKQPKLRLSAYADTAGKARDNIVAGHGKQAGDPAKGTRAIIDALQAPQPPLHLLLGKDALTLARQKLADLQREFDQWAAVTQSTDFPPEASG